MIWYKRRHIPTSQISLPPHMVLGNRFCADEIACVSSDCSSLSPHQMKTAEEDVDKKITKSTISKKSVFEAVKSCQRKVACTEGVLDKVKSL